MPIGEEKRGSWRISAGWRQAIISALSQVILGQICVQTIVHVMGMRNKITAPDSTDKEGHTDKEEIWTRGQNRATERP